MPDATGSRAMSKKPKRLLERVRLSLRGGGQVPGRICLVLGGSGDSFWRTG